MASLGLPSFHSIHQNSNTIRMNNSQQTFVRSSGVNSSLLTIPLQSLNTFSTISTTSSFNAQCKEFVTHLGELSMRYNTLVRKAVALDPTYTGSRSKGVKLAWKYEQADIEMGGKGSANWNKSQRQEIRETGTVRGAEGHHQRTVADHPEEQLFLAPSFLRLQSDPGINNAVGNIHDQDRRQ